MIRGGNQRLVRVSKCMAQYGSTNSHVSSSTKVVARMSTFTARFKGGQGPASSPYRKMVFVPQSFRDVSYPSWTRVSLYRQRAEGIGLTFPSHIIHAGLLPA